MLLPMNPRVSRLDSSIPLPTCLAARYGKERGVTLGNHDIEWTHHVVVFVLQHVTMVHVP
jgi:hypothetical protein